MIVKKIKVNSIMTKSNLPISDYSVNPYVGCTHACKYCYASFMKRFTGHEECWGDFLDVKIWDPIKDSHKYDGKELFIGSVTDPYNPQEEIYQRTRELLKQLQGTTAKISIQTKSDLVLKDLDLIKTFKNIRIGFSINTLDEIFKDDMDKAVSIKRRIEAMKKLNSEGIKTTCFISPIFPEITDIKAIINEVKGYCQLIWLENLNLRGTFKPEIMKYIKEKHKELLPLYENIYLKNDNSYWINLDKELRNFSEELKLKYITNDDSMNVKLGDRPIIVNYFYHSLIKKSSQHKKTN